MGDPQYGIDAVQGASTRCAPVQSGWQRVVTLTREGMGMGVRQERLGNRVM